MKKSDPVDKIAFGCKSGEDNEIHIHVSENRNELENIIMQEREITFCLFGGQQSQVCD